MPDDAASQTNALLDDAIDRMAAPLRHPDFAAELAFARRRLPQAMSALATTLIENDLIIDEMEMQVSGAFEDALAVRGAIDLVARDPSGAFVIIDLKWTRSPKHRFDELKSGGAVQLATYGAMLAGDAPYRAGYFLLHQRQFATLTASGLIGREIDGSRSLPETWNAVRAGYRRLHDLALEGSLVATGVEGMEDHLPPGLPIQREIRCDRCDYASLCRVRGLA